MHSRAYLLIKRDLYLLESSPVNGIDIERVADDNYFDLALILRPTKSSIWYGCMFRIFCSFYDTYNVQPPILQFDPMNIPYHPNVDPITGRISLSNSENWNPNVTLRALLDELANVFIVPNQTTIINSDAVRMLKCRSNDYQDIIDDSIEKSRQLMELINDERTGTNQPQLLPPKGKDVNRARLHTPETGARRQHTNIPLHPRISFEDYLTTWKGIATSKANLHEENPLLKQLSSQPKLQGQHLALNANELAQQLDDRALQFERLKYGNLINPERGQRMAPISQMSVPEQDQQVHVVTQTNSSLDVITNLDKHEDHNIHIKNDEVDQLIEWTQCLPTTDENIEEN